MLCNTKFDTKVNRNGSKRASRMIIKMCVVIRYGLIRGYMPIITHFGLLFIFLLCFRIYYGRLFINRGPYSACTVLTRNCQFVILSPTKKDQRNHLNLEGWGVVEFLRTLKLSGAVHLSLADILLFNCVSTTFNVVIATP